MPGKPLSRKPVFCWNVAGVWLAESATIELMTVSSSGSEARCGNRSLTHRPLLPRRAKSQSFLRNRPIWPKNVSGFSEPGGFLLGDWARAGVKAHGAAVVVEQ